MSARWPQDFTPDEVSMVLSCLANRQPVCCEEEGLVNRRTITDDKAKQDALDQHAYEAWGCGQSQDHQEMYETWLDRAINSVSR